MSRVEPARHRWYCNACTFSTPDAEEARQHSERAGTVFAHLLFERPDGDRTKPSRREAVHGELRGKRSGL